MKKLHILGLAATAILASCSQNDFNPQEKVENDRENEYLHNWIKHYNMPPANQNWCMLRAVDAEVRTALMGGVTTHIYSAAPSGGGHLIAIANGDGTVRFDLRKGVAQVYAEVSDVDGNLLSSGMYDISGGSVRIDGSKTEGDIPASRYAHDASNGRSWFDAMIVCEDLGSAADSDFDFNDIVFGLQHVAGTKTLKITPMAAGAKLAATISVTVGDETHQIGDSHDLIKPGNAGKMLNTGNPFVKGGTPVTVELPSTDWTIADAWAAQQFTITVSGSGAAYDITTPSEGSAPKMICFGGDWYWPIENKRIEEAYPGFSDWAKGDIELTAWVDDYSSIDNVVAWQWSQVADNWFSATSTGSTYTAMLNNSTYVDVNSGEEYYMYPATSTEGMFRGRTDLTSVDITGDHFNTEAVRSASGMFNGCTNLETINLSGWNTSSLTQASSLCKDCTSLETLILDGWNLAQASPVDMLMGAENIKRVDFNNATVNHWIGCSIGGSAWFTGVKDKVTTINAKNCKVDDTSLWEAFDSFSALTDLKIDKWSSSSLTDMSVMFRGCSNLTNVDMSDWDVANVTTMANMFQGCDKLKKVKMANWNTERIANTACMFLNCTDLQTIDLSSWKTPSLTNAQMMFKDCSSLEKVVLDGWDLSHASAGNMFNGCTSLTQIDFNYATVNRWIGCDIQGSPWFGGVKDKVEKINAVGCVVNDNDLWRAFLGFYALEELNISGWDTSAVTGMSQLFLGCSSLTSLDLSNWDVSNVQYMSSMFNGCTSLTELNLTNWYIPATTSIDAMFYNCTQPIHIICPESTAQRLQSVVPPGSTFN